MGRSHARAAFSRFTSRRSHWCLTCKLRVWVLDKVTPRVRFWVFKKFSKKRSNCLTCYQSLGFGYSDTSRGKFYWAHHRISGQLQHLFLVSDCRSINAFLTLAKTDLYTHGEGVERGEKVYGVIPSQRPNPSSIPHVHYPQINDAKPKGLPSPISSKSLGWQTGLKFLQWTTIPILLFRHFSQSLKGPVGSIYTNCLYTLWKKFRTPACELSKLSNLYQCISPC